jgi:uncharacterized membrane protein/ribosomal protein L37AE/L43A
LRYYFSRCFKLPGGRGLSQRCEICGNQEARFVCRRCGRRVCLQDFRQGRWLCTTCEPSARAGAPEFTSASPMGLSWIFIVSFALVFIGMVVMMIASFTQSRGQTSGGVVILIGPIPIILGSGPESTWLIALAAIITVIALGVFLLARRKAHD